MSQMSQGTFWHRNNVAKIVIYEFYFTGQQRGRFTKTPGLTGGVDILKKMYISPCI
jgi:hypothetical protein